MPQKQIFIGDQVLHGPSRAGEWIVEELEGWHEPPNPKGATADRINAHGEIDVLDYYAARMVTVSGILFHKTRAYGIGAVEALGAAMSLDSQKLVVTDAGNTRWAEAKLAGLDWTEAARSAMRFQARFKCVDPFKYGAAKSFSTSAGEAKEVFHDGTMPAWPIITVTGSMSGGYELTLNGRTVEVTKSLAAGSTHTIDMRTGILRENGDRIYGDIGIAEYFAVNPGSIQSFWPNPLAGGSGTFRIDLADTYI